MVALFAVPVLSLPLFSFCIERFILCWLAVYSRYGQDGTFFIICRCTVDFVFRIYLVFRAKIHLQISRIRVARLSICFGLQHWNFSGVLRGEAAPAEPHTHTKRRAGKFSCSWQAEWITGACAVRPSHFMTFLHNANFAQLPANDVRGIA